MMKNWILTLGVLLLVSCRDNNSISTNATQIKYPELAITNKITHTEIQSDSIAVVSIESFLNGVMMPALWKDKTNNGDDFPRYIDSARLDWVQIIERYRSANYPNAKHLLLSLNEDNSIKFNITQPQRLNDIHYIDTMLMLTYSCTTWQLATAFNREFEKYLSLPITFEETLPLFSNSREANVVGGLFDRSSNGIYILRTPDKKYKIYSYDDNTGGTGRNYCTYIQYLENGNIEWRKLSDNLPQIHKIYAFECKGRTYYAIISFQRNYTCSWTEFFDIITIEDGKFFPHPEFYPPKIQERIYTIYDRENRRKELTKVIIDAYPETNEKDITDIVEECLNEEEIIAKANIEDYGNYRPNSIKFSNLESWIDIDVDFDPKTLSVSYNDVIYTGGWEKDGIQMGLYKKAGRKSFKLNVEH